MALRLVNTAPGEDSGAVLPEQFAHFGFKSELQRVVPSSVAVAMGLTNVAHHGVLPESDTVLTDLGASVVLETSERRRPIDGVTPITLSSGNLVFTKSNLLDGEQGIYEVTFPIEERASCLASFRFKTKTAWTPFNSDWCSLVNMTGMYFGLEHGTFNTAAYAFLRANTAQGSLVVGGPLPAYNSVRPGQVEILPGAPHGTTPGFPWRSLANNSTVELHIFFNVEGYANPPTAGVPTNVPLVEIWTKTPTDPAPVVQAYLPVGSFGSFPSSLLPVPFTNSRPGTSKSARVFFGNIARTGGSDVLELEDWAFYPDFRVAVRDGVERPNHDYIARPDAPVEFSSTNNLIPTELPVGRWFPDTSSGWIPPTQELVYQPGRRGQAIHVAFDKSVLGLSGIRKTEPRFEERQDGIMVEAYLSGDAISPVGDGTGMGFAVEDGDKLYQVMMVTNPFREFYALAKDVSALTDMTLGYHVPSTDRAINTPKLVRLLIDRLRPAAIGGGKAQLVVDEEIVLTTDLSSDVFPLASSSVGKIKVGHLGVAPALSKLKIAELNYLPRYLAWEGVDGLAPDNVGLNSRILFSLDVGGTGAHSVVGSTVRIDKQSVGGPSKYQFLKNQPFSEVHGTQIDFKMVVDSYTDFGGALFPPNSPTGATLTVYLGNKRVEVGFFDCGSHGRHVAILPSSGLESDIIDQTEIGRELSAPVDWTVMTQYRLIIKGRDRIELIIGSPLSPPSISIPWRNDTDGFDLPVDVSTPRLTFGHSGGDTSSITRWSYVRWGMSDGFEAALKQQYPQGYPKYIFGGRAYIRSEFDEAP